MEVQIEHVTKSNAAGTRPGEHGCGNIVTGQQPREHWLASTAVGFWKMQERVRMSTGV